MPFDAPPDLVYLGRGNFVLQSTYTYRGRNDVIRVPRGFRTDLASVPRVIRWLVPSDGAYEAAAVLHDWCCEQLNTAHRHPSLKIDPPADARDTDGLFRRVMREQDVDVVTRWLVWVGVRWGAVANPARRPGWLKDAPLVLALSLLYAPIVVPPSLGVLVGLVVYAVVLAVVAPFSGKAARRLLRVREGTKRVRP